MSASKLCKYDCGTEITWDNGSRTFKEQDGTVHSKERCAYVKSLRKPSDAIPDKHSQPNNHMEELVQAIKELTAAIRAGRMGA